MKIAFFTEAGSKRGMGHLIRCQAIADEFRRHNIMVEFFLDSDINYDYKFDNLVYFQWERIEINQYYDAIFIDSYEAIKGVYKLLVAKTKIGIYIDDYERIVYPKGIIINFAPDAQKLFFKKKDKNSVYLLGLNYIPMREIFLKYKEVKKERKIFVMLGGSDTANLSQTIIKSLDDIPIKKTIVINNEETKKNLFKYKNISILYKPTDEELTKEMATSSYAVSTASMSLYELNLLKVSTIVIAVSENQINGLSQLINNNIANGFIDIMNQCWETDLNKQMRQIIESNQSLEIQVDGLGIKRIYDNLIKRLKI